MIAFRDIALSSLLEVHRRYRGVYCPTTETSVHFNETTQRYISEGYYLQRVKTYHCSLLGRGLTEMNNKQILPSCINIYTVVSSEHLLISVVECIYARCFHIHSLQVCIGRHVSIELFCRLSETSQQYVCLLHCVILQHMCLTL
jgi:hypothetical protein